MDFNFMDWWGGQKDSDKTFMLALGMFALYYFGKKQKEKATAENTGETVPQFTQPQYETQEMQYGSNENMQMPPAYTQGYAPPQNRQQWNIPQMTQQMPPQNRQQNMQGANETGNQNNGGWQRRR